MRLKRLAALSLALALAMPLGACASPTEAKDTASPEAIEEERQTGDAQDQGAATEDAAKQDIVPAEVPADDVSVLWEESRVHTGTSLGRYETVRTFAVAGYEDVPFLAASEYLRVAVNDKIVTSLDGEVLKVSVNGTEATIDATTDTVHFDDTDRFCSTRAIEGAVITDSEIDVVTDSVKHASTQTEPTPVTVSLAAYHMPVIAYGDDVLMPFLALQNTFGAVVGENNLAYNGRDYYNAGALESYLMKGGNLDPRVAPYTKALCSGPFSEKERTSEAYARYGYDATCLLLDLCYGHKQERNIDTFDEYFERIGVKRSLTSTNPNTVMAAELLVFWYLFDSGHDSSIPILSVFKNVVLDAAYADAVVDDMRSSEEGDELFGDEANGALGDEDRQGLLGALAGALVEKGFKIPEVVPSLAWQYYLVDAKPEDYGTQRLDYAGDTAVIYFEHFADDKTRDPSYYLEPVSVDDEEKSSFAFFYNCFADIAQHDEVKNVVINLTNNGGGAAAGLISILGFLSSDGEVDFTNLDMLSGSYREERYHVDTNLDGVADDADGLGGKYDFYIMTSGQSYSCANALPYFAQRDGLAKIIGSRPGGGDCVLGFFVDSLGYIGSYSGMRKLGTMTEGGFVSDERAVELDYDMMPSILDITSVPWFDAAGIAEAVHECKSGKTQADYGTGSGLDNLPDMLEELLSRLEGQEGTQ